MRVIISYLIPSYNHEKYLPLLLENIRLDIDCLEVPAEVIIIDDGSIDNSKAIIQTWAADNTGRFAIIYLFQENKGLPAVLNKMVDRSSGQYLRLCASDDVITVGSTQLLYEQFRSRPNLLCALADANIIDESGDVIQQSSIAFHGGKIERLVNPNFLVKELIQHWCVAGPTHLIKRSHYEIMRYDESSTIDDYDLFLSLLEVPEAVIFVNEVVCSYRVHITNTSKTKNVGRRIENIKFFLHIIERYIDRRTLAKYLPPVRYRSIAKIYFLQKKYIRCFFSMCLSIFFKVKSELRN